MYWVSSNTLGWNDLIKFDISEPTWVQKPCKHSGKCKKVRYFWSVLVCPPGKTHQNTLSSILTFIHMKFKTTGKWMQGESMECYIKEEEDGEKEEEEEEKWICTSNHLVKTSADGSISGSLSSLHLSISLTRALFLSRSDRFIKRQGSKRVPSSHLSSPLAFSSSSTTDSISSLVLPCSLLIPWPEPIFSSPLRENKRNRGWGRRWGGGDRSGEDECVFFFSSLWPALKDSLPLTHTKTCLFLSHFEQSVYFQ